MQEHPADKQGGQARTPTNRVFGSGLFVDRVSASCWFTNVRTCVSRTEWGRLRRMILRRAGHACEICGATEDRATGRWLEALERWAYDDQASAQVLRRLICLCSPCHLATHFGHASVTGRADEAFAHLRAVTGMTHLQALDHIRVAEQLWIERSARVWELDLGILSHAGISIARGPLTSAATSPRPQHRRGGDCGRSRRQAGLGKRAV